MSSAPCGHLLARPGRACPKCKVMWKVVPLPTIYDHAGTPRAQSEKAIMRSLLKGVTQADVRSLGTGKPTREYALAELCRRSFARYVREAWKVLPHLAETKLEWNWHHDALCMHLQAMAEDWALAKADPENFRQRINNLCVSIAPGTSKTLIVMVFFPTWMWARFPRWSVRCVSSNTRSIQESSDYARQLVTSDWYVARFIPRTGDESWARAFNLVPWEVRDDKNAVSDWGNTLGGFRRSTGLKAPITGEHTDWILGDDLHDAEQVNSVEERANVISKWDDAVFNRVNDTRIACRGIVGQRLRVDDIIGHLKEKQEESPDIKVWEFMGIPSEFDPTMRAVSAIGWADPRKEPGELLDKVRFPRHVLDRELARLTPRGFQAQHNQNPEADSQVAFKLEWWNWYTRADRRVPAGWQRPIGAKADPAKVIPLHRNDGSLDVDWVCVTADCTGGSIEEGASNVGLLIVAGKGPDRFVIDDLTPGPRTFLEQVEDIKNAVTTAVRATSKRSIKVLVEKKAYGGAAVAVIERELKRGDFGMVDGKPVAIHFDEYEVKGTMGSKEQRGMGMEPDLFSGVIYLPEGAAWLGPFLAEFKRFPAEPNDRVDALVQVIERYRKRMTWADAFKKVGR